ncbi:MAG TPA: alpha/beta hydrolase family protein [Armatimonadota bacterium]|jgi:S-formylglutathione hydrolase FrmB
MALCELKYFSKSLGKATACDILLPEEKLEGPFPVFYLLHGLSDDHTIWQRRTSIERYVAGLPLIVVMPDGGRGFYCDAQQGMAWESSLVADLIPYVDALFHTKATRAGRCIGGLSMGGYGAVKLALKHPDLFCSANSHSGALTFCHEPLVPAEAKDEWAKRFAEEYSPVVGEHPEGGPNDPFALAAGLSPDQRPALRVDCGTEDFLLQANRDFVAHLESLGYAHEYQEFPGTHEWGYWDLHVQEALAFHVRNLGIG